MPAPPARAAEVPAQPIVLGPESVRALGPVAATATMPAPAAEAEPKPAAAAPAVRRALIVDDSLVARMELGRVLERAGWEVEWVETAAELWSILPEGGWSIVFVDVSLPDARGRAHLKTLAAQQRVAPHRFDLVALTRDEADERLALDAGIARVLRKPFASGAVEHAVVSLHGRRA
jgi:CheY-like chemotaxis protein